MRNGFRLVASLTVALVVAGCGGVGAQAGCKDWNRYIHEVNTYSPTLNSKLELMNEADTLSDDQIEGVVNALRSDIENFRQSAPPEKAKALNNQLIVVLQGWIGIFQAIGDRTFERQMLFDLQAQDDELERLTREANAACAG